MGEINENTVSMLYLFMTNYSWEDVKAAVTRMSRDRSGFISKFKNEAKDKFLSQGWVAHEGDPPAGYEWTVLGGVLYVRNPEDAKKDPEYQKAMTKKVGTRNKASGKTDTSVQPLDMLLCPECRGRLFKEGICPACEDGKKGFKIRLLCGECDFTMLL